MAIDGFRSQIVSCYSARTRPSFNIWNDYTIYLAEMSAIKGLVDLRKQTCSDISSLGRIFTIERDYFQGILNSSGRALKEFSINLAQVLKANTIDEGSRQVVKMLENPESLSPKAVDHVFQQMKSVFASFGFLYRADLLLPRYPLKAIVIAHYFTAIKKFNQQVKEQPKLLREALSQDIPGVNKEMLPGVHVKDPTISAVVATVKDALSGICSEFTQKIGDLKEENLVVLQNLNQRYKAILQRIRISSDALDRQHQSFQYLANYIPQGPHGSFMVNYSSLTKEFADFPFDALDKLLKA